MKVHYIQHVPFEGLGYIETWLKQNNIAFTSTKVWEGASFPDINDFDGLIIMGGPMGVYDDHQHHWLRDEKKLISDAIRYNKKIIGICLGAQLVASVLGARVNANQHKEIGWFPIKIERSFSKWLASDVPGTLTVFHWHGDKFEIPDGAENHASSEACNHQLFTFGDNILGIQFHLESTPETVRLMLEHGGGELVSAPYIQDKSTIQHANEYFAETNLVMKKILEKILI